MNRSARRSVDPEPTPTLVVVGSGWYYMSGISVYTCRLANALAERGPTSVILMRRFLPRWLYPGRRRAGTELTSLRYDKADVIAEVDWDGSGIVQAVRGLLRRRPTVLLLQWWTGTVLHLYLLLALAARFAGARVVVEFHEIQDVGEAGNPVARSYVRTLFGLLRRLSSGFVVHSRHDLAELEAHYAIPRSATAVVRHGPYDHLGSGVEGSSHREANADGDRSGCCRFLYFGVIREYKGLDDLACAIEMMDAQEVQGCSWTIVGEVWEGYHMPLEAMQRSKHGDRIQIVDHYVSDDALAVFLNEADCLVLPYRRSSASGPLHVAMARGLPVVVSAVGGLVDAAEGYGGAVLVEPQNPAALKDGMLKARELVGGTFGDAYTWDDAAAALLRYLGDRRPGGAL
jgi:glycosyltransferase involved in cell wall biosynthesis